MATPIYVYIPFGNTQFPFFHVTFWYITCKSFNSDISGQWRRFHSLQRGEGLSERPVDIRHIWKLFTFSRSKKESTSPKAWAILAFVLRWIEIKMNSGIKPILFLVLFQPGKKKAVSRNYADYILFTKGNKCSSTKSVGGFWYQINSLFFHSTWICP